MVRIFHKKNGQIHKETDVKNFDFSQSHVLWIDLHHPSDDDMEIIENRYEIEFRSLQEAQEIESSSRYLETNNMIIANSNFLTLQNGSYATHPVSFILKNEVFFSFRHADLKTFAETVRKIKANDQVFTSGTQIFLSLLETRIDTDADLIESIARDISNLAKLLGNKNLSEDSLLRIAQFQEVTMLLRENIIDKQRVLSGMLKSSYFTKENYDRLRIIIKDINSLLEHTTFSFERLEYLQNTFLGLINIEQNKIIKIFTVVSVVFMPPTLIASIYGMNFRVMPELSWTFGYPMAIVIMVVSSIITLYFFKKKNWL